MPSSTPHWSNELTPQIVPWTNTLCSYSATSLPSAAGVSCGSKSGIGGAVALEYATAADQPVRRPLRLDLVSSLAERQRFTLRYHIGQQHVVLLAEPVQRLIEADKVAGDQARTLMDQLVKGMLSVGPRLSPIDRCRSDASPACRRGVTCLPLLGHFRLERGV